jgi:hypothetical protein
MISLLLLCPLLPNTTSLTSQDDTWDPWEAHAIFQQLIVYTAPKDRGKRKIVQESKHNSRLQYKRRTPR